MAVAHSSRGAAFGDCDNDGEFEELVVGKNKSPRAERLYLQLAELCIEHGGYDLGAEIVDIGTSSSRKALPATRRAVHRARRVRSGRRNRRHRDPGRHRDPAHSRLPPYSDDGGILLAGLGSYDEAEAAFVAAAEADTDTQSEAVGLSLTLQNTGRMDESLETLRQRVSASPDDAVARFFYSQALIEQGVEPGSRDFREALQGLLLAAEQLPGEASPRVELGKLHLRAKQPERAITVLQEATQLAPDDRQATYSLMMALRRVGRSNEAAALAVRLREQLDQAKNEEIQRNR